MDQVLSLGPQYRNRVWDDQIRLFNYASGKIYEGLYPYIVNWCKENDVQVVDGSKIQDTKVDDIKINDLIKALNYHTKLEIIKKRPQIFSRKE